MAVVSSRAVRSVRALVAAGAALALIVQLPACRPGPLALLSTVATTTSYLEAVTRDLLGSETAILRLAEPGACPGHFDIRPSQVRELRRCRALLRFDFQNSLDAKFTGTGTNGPTILEVKLNGGMGVPANYLTACRQAADHFVAAGLLSPAQAADRLRIVSARLEVLTRDLTNRVARAGLSGAPVIASGHQRDFCEWLGLKVVAAFRPADTARIREIETAISEGRHANVRLVIANLPEGRRTADALADRLDARVVVFENFPALHQGTVTFDQMLAANVKALVMAGSP